MLRIVHVAFIPHNTFKLCGDRKTLQGDNLSVLNV